MLPALRIVAVVVWIGLCLLLTDAAGNTGPVRLGVSAATWLLLLVFLRPHRARAWHVAVVVVYALLIEWVFAGWLGAYRYDGGGVPGYVAPGHGLLYLAAVDLGALAFARRRAQHLTCALAAVLGVVGMAGLLGRPDLLGLLWAGCLVWFVVRGGDRATYAALLPLCLVLELAGTALGTWTWALADPVAGLITIGNPPSVSAGGYVFFAAAATGLAPALRTLAASRRRPHGPTGDVVDTHPARRSR